LRRLALCNADGGLQWTTFAYDVEAPWQTFQDAGYDFYDGCAGIAQFFAALAAVTGDSTWSDAARKTWQPLQAVLRSAERREALVGQIGIGGAGLGGILYACVRTAQLLDNPSLIDDASIAAAGITADRIAADKDLDIMLGAAGAILGLLALHAVTAEDGILDAAIACGDHLLQTRTRSRDGFQAWQTLRGQLCTGFSHGAAGISYALLRLHGLTGNPALKSAAVEARRFEASLFAPEVGNWPDLESAGEQTGENQYMLSWCNGAPGIALARLAGLASSTGDAWWTDIETGLTTTRRSSLAPIDHLCCGNLGVAEVLLEAGRRLSRPDLIDAAHRRAAWVVDRARRSGFYALIPNCSGDAYYPGLFRGTAGIGYQFLRFLAPDRVPSVLQWA
jgi:type 2 lantibiotic biosynthesis protein LanM